VSESIEVILDAFRPGARVLLQGGPGESLGLVEALRRRPEAAAGVEFWVTVIPGMNRFDYSGLHEQASMRCFMSAPELAAGVKRGRVHLHPLPYSTIPAALRARRFDIGVLQARPAARGSDTFALSIAGDFGTVFPSACDRLFVIENEQLPQTARCEHIPVAASWARIRSDDALLSPSPAAQGRSGYDALARNARSFIPDGSAVQAGIGEAPSAVLFALADAADLTIRSGVITEGWRALHEAGALSTDGEHVAGIAWGEADFHRWISENDPAAFQSVETTHCIRSLGQENQFIALNSAIEVDLLGQANVEWIADRAVSGIGGALDFMEAARLSPNGRSLILLPSETSSGRSRIVAQLTGRGVSIPRSLADVVVTEYGAAELRGLSVRERAFRLAEIAAPSHRDNLLSQAASLSE